MKTVRWAELGLRSTQAFHISRDHINRRRPFPLHDHLDFVEVCWINQGRGRHSHPGGSSEPLSAGDLILARPGNAHGLKAGGTDRLRLTQLIFPLETLESLRKRHAGPPGAWPWANPGEPPRIHRIDPLQLAWFDRWAERLIDAPLPGTHLECFLLETICRLGESGAIYTTRGDRRPPWLGRTCTRMHQPENLAAGLPRMQEISGRSYGHLCRTVRRHLGQTPVTFVNRLRVRHAARLLAMSYLSVREIARACGLRNMTHFYRLFRQEYQRSPHAYREGVRFHCALAGPAPGGA